MKMLIIRSELTSASRSLIDYNLIPTPSVKAKKLDSLEVDHTKNKKHYLKFSAK